MKTPIKCIAFLCASTLAVAISSHCRAEHRVALLIGNSAYQRKENNVARRDLKQVAQAFEQYGFRCQIVENLETDSAIRDAIEGFARRTPTRSTALLYYNGTVSDGPGLLGVNSRSSYSFERMFDAFRNQGGSSEHLIFIDPTSEVKFRGEILSGCQLTFGDTGALLAKLDGKSDLVAVLASAGEGKSKLPSGFSQTGKGSQAINPPDTFAPGKRAGDEWVNSMGIVFCWCPPGKYIAGSPDNVPGRFPDEQQREVQIDDGFWLSKYELTLSQRVANRGPGKTIARDKLDPMTMINHDDAKAMTRNFTASERQAGRLANDWEYSLPTEAQWEYAARAGTTTRFYFGDDLNELPRHANFADKTYYDSGDVYSNAAHRTLNDGALKLAHVGSYQANPWGFHDIYGNVAEWCLNDAIRGGSWTSVAENCRSAYRDSFSSRNEQNFIGYRLVIQKTPHGD